MNVVVSVLGGTMSVSIVVRVTAGPLGRRERQLGAEHPEADTDDEESGADPQVGLHPLGQQPGRAQRGEDGDEDDPVRVRERDEDTEHGGVDRSSARADDVSGRDRLAVSGRGRMNGAEPETGREVEDGVRHIAHPITARPHLDEAPRSDESRSTFPSLVPRPSNSMHHRDPVG